MLLWGVATAMHVWVRKRWQLYLLRIVIGCLEGMRICQDEEDVANGAAAGFYPVTVSYLSLFYTRFEFGRRLSLFYGQAAVGGALGGVISYVVFSHFPDRHTEPGGGDSENNWKSWQILFLLEGGLTMTVALLGYVWLPHSIETAWFLSPEERKYASSRILHDRDMQEEQTLHEDGEVDEDDAGYDEESRNLLNPSRPAQTMSARASIDDRGLTPHDVLSAFLSTRIWHILACNILSAVPVYAFSVFLPLVLAPLTNKSNPALVNLLTAPPHIAGAMCLYAFASYSDKHRIRLMPILLGFAIMVSGLTAVVVLPTSWPIPRYLCLTVLVSGCYIASPLTVAWISGNTPSPGKRALLLGINGWGNLAGVISAMLFDPKYAPSGYIVPFWWTLACIALAAMGYILLLKGIVQENEKRRKVLDGWDEEDLEREKAEGKGAPVQQYVWVKRLAEVISRNRGLAWLGEWLHEATKGGREGDEKMTFVYGL